MSAAVITRIGLSPAAPSGRTVTGAGLGYEAARLRRGWASATLWQRSMWQNLYTRPPAGWAGQPDPSPRCHAPDGARRAGV